MSKTIDRASLLLASIKDAKKKQKEAEEKQRKLDEEIKKNIKKNKANKS